MKKSAHILKKWLMILTLMLSTSNTDAQSPQTSSMTVQAIHEEVDLILKEESLPRQILKRLLELEEKADGVYSTHLHHQVRHWYLTTGNSDQMYAHCDIILKNELLEGYMVQILSGHNLETDAKAARLEFEKALRGTRKFPFVQAACLILLGDLEAIDGNINRADAWYAKVLELKEEGMEKYSKLARGKMSTPPEAGESTTSATNDSSPEQPEPAVQKQQNAPQIVVTKVPLEMPIMRDNVPIGSIILPAGSRLEVAGRAKDRWILRHSSGGTVEVPSGDLLGTNYNQLVGVWQSGESHIYEFREDGTAIRAFLYSQGSLTPNAVGTEEVKVAPTTGKLVIIVEGHQDVYEMQMPFDLETPKLICYRAENGERTTLPFSFARLSPQETSAEDAALRLLGSETGTPTRAILKGWASWPAVDTNGQVIPGGGSSGGEVELVGKADGMIVIRSLRQIERPLGDIAISPDAFINRVDIALLPEVPLPKNQAEMQASEDGGASLRAIASPVSIHLHDKIVELNIGRPVEISPEQTGVLDWAVKAITSEGPLLIPKNSLMNGPPTVRSDRLRKRLPSTQSDESADQFLKFAVPYHFSDLRKDIVFMSYASVLSEGPVQTGSEHGGVPGVNIRDKDSGFSAIVPVTFFADDETKDRQFTAPVSTASAGTGMER